MSDTIEEPPNEEVAEPEPVEESEHAGLPVTKGKKWILIVWVRENTFY